MSLPPLNGGVVSAPVCTDTPPGPPQNFAISQTGIGVPPKAAFVLVSWTAPIAGGDVLNYRIWRNGVLVGSTNPDVFDFEDFSILGETYYQYYVRAANNGGGDNTATLDITTLPLRPK